MSWDFARKREKEENIADILRDGLRTAGVSEDYFERTLDSLMGSVIKVSPPEAQSQLIEMIVMNPSGRGGGRSTKPGNIRLDLGHLIETIAGGVLTLESLTNWWTLSLGVLIVLRGLGRNFSVPLSETDVVTMMAMWQAANDNGGFAKIADIQIKANYHAQKHLRNQMSIADIQNSIKNLLAIGSIAIADGLTDTWEVYEKISFKY